MIGQIKLSHIIFNDIVAYLQISKVTLSLPGLFQLGR